MLLISSVAGCGQSPTVSPHEAYLQKHIELMNEIAEYLEKNEAPDVEKLRRMQDDLVSHVQTSMALDNISPEERERLTKKYLEAQTKATQRMMQAMLNYGAGAAPSTVPGDAFPGGAPSVPFPPGMNPPAP